MNFEEEIQLLKMLIEDAKANESEIIMIYSSIVTKVKNSIPVNVVRFLNQSADRLLSPQVVDILKKYRIDGHSYLLVANNLLHLDDIKDDLLYDNVLNDALPANAIRKLKVELQLASTAGLVETHPKGTAFQINQQHSYATAVGNANTLPMEIRKECTEMKKMNGTLSFKLKLKESSTFSGASSIIRRFSFGENTRTNVIGWKTILLMGATGSGKTTMINAMINYILGVEWNDDFRFVLVDEDLNGASQAHSQTTGVTAYDIHYRKGFRVPFSLTIVDTPGFGDTKGIEHDKEITSAVKKFFEHENGIQELDAVGFVVQSALVRLTTAQTYIFNSVLSIFGKDIKENVRFLVTFSDGGPPRDYYNTFVLEAIKEAKLPCKMNSNDLPCHQSFNNAAIYTTEASSNNSQFVRYQWDQVMNNFKSFFDELNKMPSKSLQMTKEVLGIRMCLEINLDFMQKGIQQQLIKMEELSKTEKIIALNKDHINANKNFEMKVPVSKKAKVKCDKKETALNCSKCEVTCHYPCDPSLWTGFCPAFWRTDNYNQSSASDSATTTDNLYYYFLTVKTIVNTSYNLTKGLVNEKTLQCKVCPGNCSSSDHTNDDTQWGYVQEEETKTLYDIRKKYEEAMGKKLDAEGLKDALQAEVEQMKFEICRSVEQITRCSNMLKTKALQGDPLTTPEYIQMMIDNELSERKPGCDGRIKSLQQVLKKTELTKDVLSQGELTRQYTKSN